MLGWGFRAVSFAGLGLGFVWCARVYVPQPFPVPYGLRSQLAGVGVLLGVESQ